MNEDVAADLKQFITGVVTQQTADIRQDLHRLEAKVDDAFAAVANALEDMNNNTELELENHDKRFTRFEQKAV